jgi:DNA-directed RNA polymerase alpha subunit
VKLVLKKKGPGVVYAGDMKSTAKDVKPRYDGIPITELFDENQEIQLEATAQLGTGRQHVKWQGAVVGYKQDERNPETFTFNVESVCGMNVEDVLMKSLKILEHKFSEFSKAAGKLK